MHQATHGAAAVDHFRTGIRFPRSLHGPDHHAASAVILDAMPAASWAQVLVEAHPHLLQEPSLTQDGNIIRGRVGVGAEECILDATRIRHDRAGGVPIRRWNRYSRERRTRLS